MTTLRPIDAYKQSDAGQRCKLVFRVTLSNSEANSPLLFSNAVRKNIPPVSDISVQLAAVDVFSLVVGT